jgi:hypothetical protein
MADTKKPLDVPTGKAEPLGPGEPVEHSALSQMGGTFAERQAAAAGKKSTPPKREQLENSTFATRSKAVSGKSAENKSVSSASKK